MKTLISWVTSLGLLTAVTIGGCDAGQSESGGKCCPIDDHPSCCMQYGGTNKGGSCAAACDGMASPGDPGWKKGVDSEGCPIWIEPEKPASRCGEAYPVDAGPDAPDANACCPISEHPSCCMDYGGSPSTIGGCSAACDGMATPDDPGWKRSTDAKGCPIWIEPKNPVARCGGVFDAGKDASDAQTDAASDATSDVAVDGANP
jgi:hypothetical protein